MFTPKVLAEINRNIVEPEPLWLKYRKVLDQEIARQYPQISPAVSPNYWPLASVEAIFTHCLPEIAAQIATKHYPPYLLYIDDLLSLTRRHLEKSQPIVSEYIQEALCATRVSFGAQPFFLRKTPEIHPQLAIHGQKFVQELLK